MEIPRIQANLQQTDAQVTVVALLACILIATATATHGAVSLITCPQVNSILAPCYNYIHKGGTVPPGCCPAVRTLNSTASTTLDRQQACICLKHVLGMPGVKSSLVAGLPAKCSVDIGFKISPSMDCSKVPSLP